MGRELWPVRLFVVSMMETLLASVEPEATLGQKTEREVTMWQQGDACALDAPKRDKGPKG
jgi:hypothetical protein